MTALQSEDVERVEQSIRDGADVNNTEIDGTTPLIFAVKNDDRPLVKTLILSGANVDAEDSQHETALSAAIDLEYDFTVRVLVNMGGADIYKNGAFDKAMQGSDRVRDCFEYLNVRFLTEAVKNNDVDRVEEALKDERVNINGRDYNGYTPLMYAAAGGHLDIIDLLLYNGAQVAAVSKKPADYDRCVAESFGDNALFFAARNGKTESLDRLMGVSINKVKEAVMKSNKKEDLKRNINRAAIAAMRGAEIALTRRNNLGQTLLISALKNGREDTTIWLIDHGTNVNNAYHETVYRDEYGRSSKVYVVSPLAIAKRYNLREAVEKLRNKGAISININVGEKISDRQYKRKLNDSNHEDSLEAVVRMYENEEKQFPAEVRKARRAEAEANYEDSLESASDMYRREEEYIKFEEELTKAESSGWRDDYVSSSEDEFDSSSEDESDYYFNKFEDEIDFLNISSD